MVDNSAIKLYNIDILKWSFIMEGTNQKITKSHKAVLDMVYTAMFSALICVCSLISVPIGEVPVTLQTFAMCLTGAMLGWKRGGMSVLIYVLLGAAGLPVFAEGKGGIGIITGATGGYIVGFIFTALIVGFAAEKFDKKLIPLAVSMVIGVAVCYALGTAWFMFVTKMDLLTSLGYCVIPFIIFDAIKIIFATIMVNRLSKIIKL